MITTDASLAPGVAERGNLHTLTHLMYGLHTVTFFSAFIFSVIAIILNFVKFGDLPNDFYRSHWRWQSRTFWFTLLWAVLTLPLWLLFVFPGWLAWTVLGLWYLYRCIRGWWTFYEGRPMPMPV
jgi:uncharacterized membrane protein